MYNEGETIPPILFHRMEDGKIKILDGRARLEAFRRLGIPRIPAVENGILSSIKAGVKKLVSGTKGFKEGVKVASGMSDKVLPKSTSVAQSVGRKAGLTATNIAKSTRKAGAQAIEHAKAVYNILDGQGTVVKGQKGGGDLVIPSKKFVQTRLSDTPVGHRPAVIEKKVKGKTLYVYGTLLDPRTNPRYMQKYGYTDIE
jgi:hypothetical protein